MQLQHHRMVTVRHTMAPGWILSLL
jgi:hypothetical protein